MPLNFGPPIEIDSYTGEYAYRGKIIREDEVPAAREDYERLLDSYENAMEAEWKDREVENFET